MLMLDVNRAYETKGLCESEKADRGTQGSIVSPVPSFTVDHLRRQANLYRSPSEAEQSILSNHLTCSDATDSPPGPDSTVQQNQSTEMDTAQHQPALIVENNNNNNNKDAN